MFSPRNLIIAGAVLIAVALGSSGHGFWWLFGLFWVLPHAAGRSHVCRGGHRARRSREDTSSADAAVGQPDPTQDRHEAFPVR
ncbi:hypothetical protein [Terracoccus sp. 273MFTsu3.1]|uniref:hypothetical protein n=1 Tax=Terracoccus sp. 273MFTsu3.1 TaxID=1172188 RepID=UPI0003806DD4|nr:hypothetical protein [Terracoccus sp. 273MFTsu3.1]